jgi:hemerythrin
MYFTSGEPPGAHLVRLEAPGMLTRLRGCAAMSYRSGACMPISVMDAAREPDVDDFFEWDAGKFGLGVRDMDAEHQTLIALMNALHRLHQAGAPRSAQARAVTELVSFTVKHFADEEAYMEKIGYPDLRVHAGVHRNLLKRVTEYHDEFQKTGQLGEAFFMFLKTWLKAHICGVDARYGAHARQHHAA